MKIKSQDLRPGMRVRQASELFPSGGPIITLERVEVFAERKAPFTGIGKTQVYFPACVLVAWGWDRFTHTFFIDEELDLVLE